MPSSTAIAEAVRARATKMGMTLQHMCASDCCCGQGSTGRSTSRRKLASP